MSAPLAPFARRLTSFGSRIGEGEIGGKAAGLLRAARVLAARFPDGRHGPFHVGIPCWTVLTTGLYQTFVDESSLVSRSAHEDEGAVARAFAHAPFPATLAGDLWALGADVHVPLAVRSSSLLEDALAHPLAGVYATKMTPNDAAAPATRSARLAEAVKLVWASGLFPSARAARAGFGVGDEERMAVVVQEVVGRRHGGRYYPDVSGVARSTSFYRFAGARPEEGMLQLALGLGKTIVDGGASWRAVPTRPRAPAPFGSARDRLDATQRTFWAIRLGEPPHPDPLREEEFLVRGTLEDAEADGTLALCASTWDAAGDRFVPGISEPGPRAVDFAPILVHDALPLAPLVREVLAGCEEELGQPVEIEFAVTLGREPRFGLLQLRPMKVAAAEVELSETRAGYRVLVRSDRVLGNGVREDVRDVVHLRRDAADPALSRQAAAELAQHDRALREEGLGYLLVVFGRLGSSDPWLGVPAGWGHVAGAKAIVEASLPGRPVEMSEGSHLFHNLAAAGVPYFSVPPGEGVLDWESLEALRASGETPLVRRARFARPMRFEVDGRCGRGAIFVREDP